MDSSDFRKYGKELIDFAADYLENAHERRVYPDVEPGYLQHALPREAPETGEEFPAIMKDFQSHIMRGVTHWQSPYFYAYYPGPSSYPAILGELLSFSLNSLGFTWASNPASTELEIVVLDWLAKMLQLPQEFLAYDNSGKSLPGGAIIQTSGSDAVLIGVLAAREDMLERMNESRSNEDKYSLLSRFVAYCSDETHSAFEKACKIAAVTCRALESNADNELEGDVVEKAILEDREKGLIPFIVCATLGTTSTCSFDKVKEIGPICNENKIWFHIDAAYAGSAFICPEYRPLFDGVENADSCNISCNKLMLVNFDCSPLWVKDKEKVINALSTDFVLFSKTGEDLTLDFKDMQVQLGRRFRALKLWFVVRTYGVKGLQQHVYRHCKLAKYFAGLVEVDERFEVLGCRLGLLLFRLKGDNELNEALIKKIQADGTIFFSPTLVKGKRVIRIVICSKNATEKHLDNSWNYIQEVAHGILEKRLQEKEQ